MAIFRRGPDWSDDHGWQSHDGIIAQGGHGFQGHVAGALDGPFVVLFEQDRAHEPDEGVVVGEDADDADSDEAARLKRNDCAQGFLDDAAPL